MPIVHISDPKIPEGLFGEAGEFGVWNIPGSLSTPSYVTDDLCCSAVFKYKHMKQCSRESCCAFSINEHRKLRRHSCSIKLD
jgi:hypothetical protein